MHWKLVQPRTSLEKAALDNDAATISAPVPAVFMAALLKILGEDMGLNRSFETGESRMGDGSPVPMISLALIEYLDGLDLSAFDVLEIGGGLSTEFWAARAKSVTTLETNPDWVRIVAGRAPKAKVEFVQGSLADRVAAFDRSFDIIVIDPAGNRFTCAQAAIGKLEPGGFIILDNSEWYPNASRKLREAGLIEIDFHDLRHCHHFRATTSLYLTPEFRPKPKQDRLPRLPIGGKQCPVGDWDQG